MSTTRAEWQLERAAALDRRAARIEGATIRPLRSLAQVPAIHVLDAEPIDPFWRTTPPPLDEPEPEPEPEPVSESPDDARDPWAALPESVRVVDGMGGVRSAFLAERLWMGGSYDLPDLLVQRLWADLRTEGVDFHTDLRGWPEETRAWALETADRAGLDPAVWRLSVLDLQHWDVDPAELDRMACAPNATIEPDPVFAALDAVREQQRILNRTEYLRVEAAVRAWRVALADEGRPGVEGTPYQSGFFQDLGLQLGISERTAKSMVQIAARLTRDLPTVWDGFAAGVAPWRTMQAAHAAIDGISDADVLRRFDAEAAALLREIPVVQLPDALRRIAERLQPTTRDDRFEAALGRRFVRIEAAKDGMGWLTAYLPMVGLVAIDDQLTKAAIAEHDRADGATGGITALRADILTDGLIDALSRDAEPAEPTASPGPDAAKPATDRGADAEAGDTKQGDTEHDDDEETGPKVPYRRGIQARVGILIPALTALGHATAPATLEGYGPIGMKTALALAADAPSWIRVLTDRFTGAIITVGREKYRPTADMRAMLRMIDGGGRGPGCSRPPSQTEVDHNRSFWQNGERGETSIRNLVLLSNRDHAKKTAGEIEADLLSDRTLLWETRAGNRYVTRPHDPPVPTPIPPELIDPDDLDDCPFWSERTD